MLRFSNAIVIAVTAVSLCGGAKATPIEKTIWIGQHVHEVGADSLDRADAVADYVDLLLGLYRGGLTFDTVLRDFLANYDVKIDQAIHTRGNDREAYFQNNIDSSLLVASGRGIGAAENLASGIYLGPERADLKLEVARAKLLAVQTNSAADMYFQLILHYALIKDAIEQGMDRKTIVNPLISKAIDLIDQASPAEPNVVLEIEQELSGLLD